VREETVPTGKTEYTNCLQMNGIAQYCLRAGQIVDLVRSSQGRKNGRCFGCAGTGKAKRDKQCQAHLCKEQKTDILLALIGRSVLVPPP
jgi:hypothetical protein